MPRGKDTITVTVAATEQERQAWKAFAKTKHWSVSQVVRVAVEQYIRAERLTEMLVKEASKSLTYEQLLAMRGDDGEPAAKAVRSKAKT